MGFGSVLAPIVSVKLVKNVLGFSASFILPCNRGYTIGRKCFNHCDVYSIESFSKYI